MKTVAVFAPAILAVLALGGCGSSDSANEPAQAENVEIPAEDAMASVPAAATPVADPAAAVAPSGAALTTPSTEPTTEPAAGATAGTTSDATVPVTPGSGSPVPPTVPLLPPAADKKM